MSRKVKWVPREGVGFVVPLRSSRYALGVVARVGTGGVLLGYFFGPAREEAPDESALAGLSPSSAVLVERFGDLGLQKGSWPIIGSLSAWERSKWPVPLFARFDETRGTGVLVHYSDKDLHVERETACSATEAKGYARDGLSGYGAIEVVLTKRLDPLGTMKQNNVKKSGLYRFYLYFKTEKTAEAFIKENHGRWRSMESRRSADDRSWLVLVSLEPGSRDTLPGLEKEFDALARSHGGEYDGWEG